MTTQIDLDIDIDYDSLVADSKAYDSLVANDNKTLEKVTPDIPTPDPPNHKVFDISSLPGTSEQEEQQEETKQSPEKPRFTLDAFDFQLPAAKRKPEENNSDTDKFVPITEAFPLKQDDQEETNKKIKLSEIEKSNQTFLHNLSAIQNSNNKITTQPVINEQGKVCAMEFVTAPKEQPNESLSDSGKTKLIFDSSESEYDSPDKSDSDVVESSSEEESLSETYRYLRPHNNYEKYLEEIRLLHNGEASDMEFQFREWYWKHWQHGSDYYTCEEFFEQLLNQRDKAIFEQKQQAKTCQSRWKTGLTIMKFGTILALSHVFSFIATTAYYDNQCAQLIMEK